MDIGIAGIEETYPKPFFPEGHNVFHRFTRYVRGYVPGMVKPAEDEKLNLKNCTFGEESLRVEQLTEKNMSTTDKPQNRPSNMYIHPKSKVCEV